MIVSSVKRRSIGAEGILLRTLKQIQADAIKPYLPTCIVSGKIHTDF
jgi:hypothetical protein